MYFNAFLKSSTKFKLGKFDSQNQATKTLILTNNKCHYLSIYLSIYREVRWPSGRAYSGARGPGIRSSLGLPCCILEHLPPKSTGNTQEAVAPSRHD